MKKYLLLAVAVFAMGAFGDRPEKPNVVLLLTDDLGWQDVGCFDIDELGPMETPNIDRFATKGVLFRQGYSPSPTCAPSRCAIMSGDHPARAQKTHVVGGAPPAPYHKQLHRMMPPWYSGRMPAKTVSIAEALQTNGYTTGHCGKWHLAINHYAYPQPEDQGFEWTQHNLGITQRMRPHRLTGFSTDEPSDAYRYDENGFSTHQNSEDALTFVRENKQNPFFLFYSTWLVHAPIQTRNERLLKKYCAKLGVEYPENPKGWDVEGQNNPYYCAMVEELDYYVGKLFNMLETTEDPRWPGHMLSENTYVIFTSDNGGMEYHPGEIITDNYPLARGKISAMEGGTRVPLIIAGPNIPAGVDSDVVVNGLDFYPTILSWTGTERPEDKNLDGCDISELLEKDPLDGSLIKTDDGSARDTMVWHFPNSVALESTIRVGDYKLVRNYDHVNNPGSPELELFRLYKTVDGKQIRCDIEEAHNLADSMPEKAQALNRELTTRLTEMKASYPYYNPGYIHALPNKEKVPTVVSVIKTGMNVDVSYVENGARVVRANLIYTLNGGSTYDEEWFRLPATLLANNKVHAELPEGTTHYVIDLIDENNFLVSCPNVDHTTRTTLASQTAYSIEDDVFVMEVPMAHTEKPIVKPKAPVKAKASATAAGFFDRVDHNGDQRVTAEEYVEHFEKNATRLDLNKDGVLTAAEFPYAGAFSLGDADDDGKLTKSEVRALYTKQFDSRDVNSDGFWTSSEVK